MIFDAGLEDSVPIYCVTQEKPKAMVSIDRFALRVEKINVAEKAGKSVFRVDRAHTNSIVKLNVQTPDPCTQACAELEVPVA